MYTLDANIFVRDLTPHDPEHPACHDLIAQLRHAGAPIINPLITMPEVASAISRTYRDALRGRLAAERLRQLPNLTLATIDAVLAEEASNLAADYALRGMDAIYVAVARQHGGTFVTLDGEPRRRAATVITIQTPAEALAALAPPEA